MQMYRVTGFGIDGDYAIVEAASIEHAVAKLANHLQQRSIEFHHTDTWRTQLAERPLLIVKWQEV